MRGDWLPKLGIVSSRTQAPSRLSKKTTTIEDLVQLDRKRKGKKLSKEVWTSPTDPDAKIARMKDGLTHLAFGSEHAVDLDTGWWWPRWRHGDARLARSARRRLGSAEGVQRSIRNPSREPGGYPSLLHRPARPSGGSSTMLPFGGSVALFLAELGPAALCRSKGQGRPLSESRKLAAIFAADVVGFSRLAGADEDRILARLRALRSDLIDPTIEVHRGRVVKRTGDGVLAEFRSVVDAVRCAIEVQNSMVERNAGVPEDRRIVFRIGIHIGDVVEESDGDLMGDGVNIAARLEGVAKPGAICLSEDAYRQVRSRLDLKVSDLGLTPLKNIVEPVHIYSLEVGAAAEPKPATPPPAEAAKPVPMKRRWGVVPLAASVAALLILAAAGAWITVGGRGSTPAEPTHLSMVVLPFANLSGDPSQDYFADGVTENLTDGLSRIRDSFVIARNTAFTYKGESVDAKQVGKDLGVRYVLEGSVQRDQSRVRINAQLTDVESNAHVWADRFEENLGDLPKLQGRIVARIASSLHYELAIAQTEKGPASQNPDATDLALRGWAELEQTTATRAHREAAKPLFEQALGIDPNDSDALAGAAAVSMFEYFSGAEFGHGHRLEGHRSSRQSDSAGPREYSRLSNKGPISLEFRPSSRSASRDRRWARRRFQLGPAARDEERGAHEFASL